jgi:hypothetical protein
MMIAEGTRCAGAVAPAVPANTNTARTANKPYLIDDTLISQSAAQRLKTITPVGVGNQLKISFQYPVKKPGN